MPGISVEFDNDKIDAVIARAMEMKDAVTGDQVRNVMGEEMRKTVVANFEKVAADSEHHESSSSLGATRTGFYIEAAQATENATLEVVSDGVVLSIAHEGLAQRYFGGDIQAKPGSFLTIPARAEAYGKRAHDVGVELKLIKFPSGLYALIDPADEEHEGNVYYWLVREVHQQGDTDILPTDDEVTDAAADAGGNYLDRIWERQIAA